MLGHMKDARLRQRLDEHSRIFEAIAANAPVAATQAMHDHLTRANVLYQTAVQPPKA